MTYKVRKLQKKLYQFINTDTGEIKSKHTSLEHAENKLNFYLRLKIKILNRIKSKFKYCFVIILIMFY